jgi:hypothetical protein
MKELKFIHITKCAGTFIEKIGKSKNINWGVDHYRTGEYGHWHEPFSQKEKSLKEKYDWFVIVRNPYTRILSEYYCQWGGIGRKTNVNHSKEEFNEFLINKINRKPVHHYTEQYKYIDNESNINIIKFENLNEELEILFKKYKLNIDLKEYKKENSKEEKNNEIKFTINDFNNRLINLINDVYKKDFELFGYEMINI